MPSELPAAEASACVFGNFATFVGSASCIHPVYSANRDVHAMPDESPPLAPPSVRFQDPLIVRCGVSRLARQLIHHTYIRTPRVQRAVRHRCRPPDNRATVRGLGNVRHVDCFRYGRLQPRSVRQGLSTDVASVTPGLGTAADEGDADFGQPMRAFSSIRAHTRLLLLGGGCGKQRHRAVCGLRRYTQ